jgi:hypothetical protein
VAQFGEEEAAKIETVAEQHGNGINDQNRGSDHFRWALCIAIGYECVSRDKFREYHGIAVDPQEFNAWVKAEAELDKHDGDCDYLALLAGVYNEFMPAREES